MCENFSENVSTSKKMMWTVTFINILNKAEYSIGSDSVKYEINKHKEREKNSQEKVYLKSIKIQVSQQTGLWYFTLERKLFPVSKNCLQVVENSILVQRFQFHTIWNGFEDKPMKSEGG